ncbi:polyprenyl synthetase family protein [Pontibacillus halophilus]|nr:polyprenyl synthetase family protein [Pontibacillus halophilus]
MLQSSAELLDHAIDQDEDYGISREELMMLGNYLYTKSIQNLMQAGQSHWNDKIQERLLTNLISCLEMAWLGQWEDYITTYHCVNEEEYLNMVMNKSGKLYEIVFKSIGHLAELKEKDCQILAKAGNQIAVAAQLSNDIQGIYSPKKADLEQMKASVPIIRGIEYSKQQDQKLLHLLQKAEDSTSIEEIRPSILEYLEVNRLFEYTKVLINVYFNEGMDLMSKWTDHHHRKQFYELFGLKEV